MKTHQIKIHEIATDGLPKIDATDPDDPLIGCVAFLFDGNRDGRMVVLGRNRFPEPLIQPSSRFIKTIKKRKNELSRNTSEI